MREPVALRPVLEQLVDDIEPRARQRGVNLAIDAHDAADPAVVEGDPFLLRQALGNLLDNALDFAPQGSTIRIALERQPAGKAHVAVVRVADDGPGVPDYALARVFERFYSLPRPDGQDRSTGLGLFRPRGRDAARGALANRDEGGACATLTLPSAG